MCECDWWIDHPNACSPSSRDGTCCWDVCCRFDSSCLTGAGGHDLIEHPGYGFCSSALAIFLIALLLGTAIISTLLVLALRRPPPPPAIGASNFALTRTLKLLFGIWICSLVIVLTGAIGHLFAHVGTSCYAASAVAFGLVPLVSTTLLLLLCALGKLVLDAPLLFGKTVGVCFAAFFSLWWAVATVVLTFFGPFTATSNAFFACWAALVLSAAMLFEATGSAETARSAARGEKRAVFGLLIASLALFGACVPRLSDASEAIYLLVGSILSALTVLVLLLRSDKLGPKWRTILVILLFLLWITLAWFATVVGPFQQTGNGYFSAWLGCGCSLLALLMEANRSEADTTVDEMRQAASRHTTFLLGVGSLVLVIESIGGRDGLMLYALVVGGVSLALVVTLFIHRTIKSEEAAELLSTVGCKCREGGTTYTYHILLSLFLTLWWAVGAGVLTFLGPFTTTSNAYFSIWASLICAVAILIDALKPAADTAAEASAAARGSKRGHYGLLLACIVLGGSCISIHANGFGAVWALICCALSAVLVVLLLITSPEKLKKGGAGTVLVLILLIIWVTIVWFTTFAGPFVVTGNGYFAAWSGMLCAGLLVAGDETALGLVCCAPCRKREEDRAFANHNDPVANRQERTSLTLAASQEQPSPGAEEDDEDLKRAIAESLREAGANADGTGLREEERKKGDEGDSERASKMVAVEEPEAPPAPEEAVKV